MSIMPGELKEKESLYTVRSLVMVRNQLPSASGLNLRKC